MKDRLTFPCGALFGVPIRVHYLVPVLGVVLLVTTPGYLDREVFLPFLAFGAVMVASVLLHEMGHAFAARHHHLEVHGITIWPLGGLCHTGGARTPRSQFQVKVAGVAVSFGLGLLAWGFFLLRGESPGVPKLTLDRDLLRTIWNLNVALGLFNLLPGHPFDGGGAIEALLWKRFGRPKARLAMCATGALVGAGLLVGGIANDEVLMSCVGGWALYSVARMYYELREGGMEEETLLGVYDFSRGYTSLDENVPAPDREEERHQRKIQRAARDAERREAADAAARVSARERLDGLLDRISTEGISSLTDDERAFLQEESRRLRALRRGKSPSRP